MMQWWSISLILFLIIDPLGKISTLLQLMHKVEAPRERIVLFREMAIALGLMLIFSVLGEWIFLFLVLSESGVDISAGIILFLTALRILFPRMKEKLPPVLGGEPMLVPIAVPLIASPALLAMVMIFSHIQSSYGEMVWAIVCAWMASVAVLFFAKPLHRLLGNNGLIGVERLMGMILVMLAVQRVIEGLKLFVASA